MDKSFYGDTMNMKQAKEILTELGLSDSEVSLYVSLVKGGALTARELMRDTGAKRPTVYYALRQLQERGLVSKTGSVGVERFQAEDPHTLTNLISFKKQHLEKIENELKDVIPLLRLGGEPHEGMPGIHFFEGDTAVKQIITETLYGRDRHIDSLAPSDNFFWQIGQEFSADYISQRVRKKISTRNLWEEPLEPEIMLRSYKGLSQVRILPEVMRGKFKTTIFLYDDKVLYISSRKAGYALLVKSKEHYETMKAMYDGLWFASEKVVV